MKATTEKIRRFLRNNPELTEPEKLCLKVLREMARRKEPFSYERVCQLAGWKSTNMAWETCSKLEARGLVARGKRLAIIECPVEVPRAA